MDCLQNVTKNLLLPSGPFHRYQNNSCYDISIYIYSYLSQCSLQKKITFVQINPFFRRCVVLLFGKVSGATDGHRARGSGHSLRRRQVHNCYRQLQLGWVGSWNLHLCRHSEGGWKLHKDWLSTHKLPGHVSISTISGDCWVLRIFKILLSFPGLRLFPKDRLCWCSSSPRASLSSPLTGLEFSPGLHLLTMPF